jgi:hypothetical protein
VQPLPSTRRRDAKDPSRTRAAAKPDGVAGALAASEARKGSGDSPASSAAVIEAGMCRICHTRENETCDEKLLALCACSGTSGLMHMSCLFVWQRRGHEEECELCQTPWK